MFGELDCETDRAPSPWDSIIFRSAQWGATEVEGMCAPKLTPEVEEGNVEYKLQLLSPSPARFSRLVTQLKWRLLEGGGRALYELGVADSGALVGLPRAELAQSLRTLEMMAAEIGAAVTVVREIEVPLTIAGCAAARMDGWNVKRRMKRARQGGGRSGGNSPLFDDEAEGSSTPLFGDADDDSCYTASSSPDSVLNTPDDDDVFALPELAVPWALPSVTSVGVQPQSTTAPVPISKSLSTGQRSEVFGLTILSVYKPCSTLAHYIDSPLSRAEGGHNVCGRAKKNHQLDSTLPLDLQPPTGKLGEATLAPPSPLSQTKQQAKRIRRDMARDRRKNGKAKALEHQAVAGKQKDSDDAGGAMLQFVPAQMPVSPLIITSTDLISDLEQVRLATLPAPTLHAAFITDAPLSSLPQGRGEIAIGIGPVSGNIVPAVSQLLPAQLPPPAPPAASTLRFILEALIMWEAEDVVPDFGGFVLS